MGWNSFVLIYSYSGVFFFILKYVISKMDLIPPPNKSKQAVSCLHSNHKTSADRGTVGIRLLQSRRHTLWRANTESKAVGQQHRTLSEHCHDNNLLNCLLLQIHPRIIRKKLLQVLVSVFYLKNKWYVLSDKSQMFGAENALREAACNPKNIYDNYFFNPAHVKQRLDND